MIKEILKTAAGVALGTAFAVPVGMLIAKAIGALQNATR